MTSAAHQRCVWSPSPTMSEWFHNIVTMATKIMTVLLGFQVLTLAEVHYKIPLKIGKGEVEFAEDASGIEHDNLHGKPGQGYYIEMELGTPPQKLNVLVDTGSSNFAVAATPDPSITDYFDRERSSTFKDDGTTVYVPYTQGDWQGPLGRDEVSLSSLPNVSINANIACITQSSNFFINGSNWEGILGMAYRDIARPDSSIEPFFDSLIDQTDLEDVFSMQLCGTVDEGRDTDVSMGGTLVLGGIDGSLYRGDIQYATIHKEWYYEVIMTDVQVSGQSLAMDCKEYNFDKTIVDSGTTNLRLPSKVFEVVKRKIAENTALTQKQPPPDFWTGLKVLCWPENQIPWELFPYITISLAESHNSSFDIHISPQQYLRAVGEEYDPTITDDCFKFAIAESDTGTVLGAVVMEGFYVIYDRKNKRVGFAETTCPNRNPIHSGTSVTQPYSSPNTSHCAYYKPPDNESMLMIVAYTMAAICGVCLLPLLILVLHWQYQHCRRNPNDMLDPLFSVDDH